MEKNDEVCFSKTPVGGLHKKLTATTATIFRTAEKKSWRFVAITVRNSSSIVVIATMMSEIDRPEFYSDYQNFRRKEQHATMHYVGVRARPIRVHHKFIASI